MGIYEKHNLETGHSLWILVQPSERVRRRLLEGLKARRLAEDKDRMVMILHAAFLTAAHRAWAEYLDELNQTVQVMVDLHFSNTV